MLPFFRKIRWRLAENNQFFKYSRYAIGEIVLVVIGILIALYVNNRNEEREERQKFDQVLVDVETELINNIFNCRNNLKYYLFSQDSIASLILFDEMTDDDYRANTLLGKFTQGNYYPVLKIDEFDKLLKNNGMLSPVQDSIRGYLKIIYGAKGEIDEVGQQMNIIMRQQIKDYKKYSWYNDWLADIPNEDRISYLVNNPEYKKDVAEYISVQMGSLRPDVESFEINGRFVYKYIFDYLESNMIKHDGRSSF